MPFSQTNQITLWKGGDRLLLSSTKLLSTSPHLCLVLSLRRLLHLPVSSVSAHLTTMDPTLLHETLQHLSGNNYKGDIKQQLSVMIYDCSPGPCVPISATSAHCTCCFCFLSQSSW